MPKCGKYRMEKQSLKKAILITIPRGTVPVWHKARGKGQVGLAILLAERSAYKEDLTARAKSDEKETRGSAKCKEKRERRGKLHAQSRGCLRGAYGGLHDAILVQDEPELDLNAKDEGLHVFLQTGMCCRQILMKVYGNDIPTTVKKGVISEIVRKHLQEWQKKVYKRDFAGAMFASPAILRDETVDLLALVGPIQSTEELKKLVGMQWQWWPKYGGELAELSSSLDIPAFKPLLRKPQGEKIKKAVEGDIIMNDLLPLDPDESVAQSLSHRKSPKF
ncbi:hypothetical protein SERLA73DRAFT_150908 [Serpula lacrymans var. lacrymans S7.3]|uniref:Uncharacterized protein n=1 Tax=Serpula lacrymans var. lacrymans (strain S7.3) TaxID=936435 RepID=F8PNV0_SERL3|nr:hypothetical protein SERLA73DRAFT_150908 [Serpula lacrymans var. lacrymans S7.3]